MSDLDIKLVTGIATLSLSASYDIIILIFSLSPTTKKPRVGIIVKEVKKQYLPQPFLICIVYHHSLSTLQFYIEIC